MLIGVTERGDAGLDFSWVHKLRLANIIISKVLNDHLIEELVHHRECIIFHMTCTGFGGTVLEPNVPTLQETLLAYHKLIAAGFPAEQVVLRLDPIIPTEKGLTVAESVLKNFCDLGIRRVRYSFLDMYPHVTRRFVAQGIPLPYDTFNPPLYMVHAALALIDRYEKYYTFEACAEGTKHQLGCLSQKDLTLLGIQEDVFPCGVQRRGCLCVAGKTELLMNKHRCPNGCLYCYWRD